MPRLHKLQLDRPAGPTVHGQLWAEPSLVPKVTGKGGGGGTAGGRWRKVHAARFRILTDEELVALGV